MVPVSPKMPLLFAQICSDCFGHVFSFLDSKDLARAEAVQSSWNKMIEDNALWEDQYLKEFNLGPSDPVPRTSGSRSYKRTLQVLRSRVYGQGAYRRFLGAETEFRATPTVTRFGETDPCDRLKSKGEMYFWIHSPSYFEICVDDSFPFELDKPDDPNDPEAPRLIPKVIRAAGSSVPRSISTPLKVPNTIHNLSILFQRPKIGNPFKYVFFWSIAEEEHRNRRIPAGVVCMRERKIGVGLSSPEQESAADRAGVELSTLGHRLLFNALRHADTGHYADGRDGEGYGRTRTTSRAPGGSLRHLSCGAGSDQGLHVIGSDSSWDLIGASVCLKGDNP